MNKLLTLLLLIPLLSAAQPTPTLNTSGEIVKQLSRIQTNAGIPADSAFKLLTHLSDYPDIKRTGTDHVFYYNDPYFGRVPVRVYIPAGYNHKTSWPCVLLLHGATGGSRFADLDSVKKFNDDVMFAGLKGKNYIVIRPAADRTVKFDWVVNHFSKIMTKGTDGPNLTYQTLAGILTSLKQTLNIDDNKVFTMGHSDGADGAIGFAVYSPGQFAGSIAYNSMMVNLFARDFYIRNAVNRPVYIVHSDLDDLRPIQETRVVTDMLKPLSGQLIYKEYIGYQHYDKHLMKDLPYVANFISNTSRDPFKKNIWWEAADAKIYNSTDWLKISVLDTAANRAVWHTNIDIKGWDKRNKQVSASPKYPQLKPGSAVKASFYNNTFELETSRVAEVELLISPVMVNLEEPVKVIANGKQVFSGKVIADKQFIINNFKSTFDKAAIWVNAIKIKVN